MKHRFVYIILFCFGILFTGCSGNDHTSTSVTGAAINADTSGGVASGQAVSGEAVSGDAVDADSYEVTPEMDQTLRWLSTHQEAWCNEASHSDKSTLNYYAITDMNHNGLIEVAQFVDMDFVSYSEIAPKDDTYELTEVASYNPEDYSMGLQCDTDEAGNTIEAFTRDDHPDLTLPESFRPRSEAAWAIIPCANGESIADTEAGYVETDDPHITYIKNDNIYFGSGIDIRITAKADEDVMYQTLRENLEAFLYCDRVSAQIRSDLMKLYESEPYTAAAQAQDRILVTDEDGDGHPDLTILPKDEYKKKSRRKKDKISVKASADDSSRVGLAYIRYCVWKTYLLDTDKLSNGFMGLFMPGANVVSHYFPDIYDD